jgi:UDP-2,3-diacylglucosamine pyrophosphatase LpxH
MESLVVLSDVHLGSDLGLPDAPPPPRSPAIDADLCRLLDHYRATKPAGERWRLVIAGDFIDFVGMTLPPEAAGSDAPLDEEERLHGLGSTPEHALAKLRAVVARHADVFAALGRFLGAGHAITLVRGNHDLELHWDEVRAELVRVLVDEARRAHAALGDMTTFDAATTAARVEETPWFYEVEGVAYIEHGHQYDPFCAVEHVLAPCRPRDPRRTARGFIDVLLRFVVRPTPGVPEHGHETMGVLDYFRIAARLGPGGMARLVVRFVRAVRELFRVRADATSEAAARLAAEHEQLLARYAAARRIGRDKLRALRNLQVAPITRTVRGILASLLLDQLALGALALVLCATLGVLALTADAHFGWGLGAALVGWPATSAWLRRGRRIDSDVELRLRAEALSALFAAPIVVMGHTHIARRQRVGRDATYVNVGSWSECEGHRATRTHLVIERALGGLRAELRAWCPERGPLPAT